MIDLTVPVLPTVHARRVTSAERVPSLTYDAESSPLLAIDRCRRQLAAVRRRQEDVAERREGLDAQQSQQLRDLLQQFTDIFAAQNQDCTQTNLVQHSIDTGMALPIRL